MNVNRPLTQHNRRISPLKQLFLLLIMSILSMSMFTIGSASAATTACSNGAVGSASISATISDAAPATIWILITNNASADLELRIDGNNCVRQTFGINQSATWQKFDINVNLNAGTRTITIGSFSNPSSISKIAIVHDGRVPFGDGSNVTTVTNTNTCASTGILGSATYNVSTDANSNSNVWLLISSNVSGDLEFKVDNNNCVRQTFTSTSNSQRWVKFNSALNLSSGSHQIILNSFSNGITVHKFAIVVDGMTPSGDGTNVITPDTPTTTTTKAPATTTPPTTGPTTTKGPVNSTYLGAGTYDDKAASFSANWILAGNGSGENKYSGADYYTTTQGSNVTIKFKGTDISIYGAKAPWHGKLKVSIDGGTSVEVDEYNSTRVDQSLVFNKSGLSNTEHTIVLTATGAKNSLSTGTSVAIDKFVVGVSNTPSTTSPPTTQAPTTTKGSTPTTVPSTSALNTAITKIKADHNLVSVKTTSFVNNVLTARGYYQYTGLFYLAVDFSASISPSGDSYTINSTQLIVSFVPIP